jgi:dUTP pyrophosphatase
MEPVRVLIQRLPNYPVDWALPSYGTAGSAAVDLRNAGPAFELPSLGRNLVPTGLAIALPQGMEAQIRPRSGLALHRGISIINTPCTIDSGTRYAYRMGAGVDTSGQRTRRSWLRQHGSLKTRA